jgi:hypothetical protein
VIERQKENRCHAVEREDSQFSMDPSASRALAPGISRSLTDHRHQTENHLFLIKVAALITNTRRKAGVGSDGLSGRVIELLTNLGIEGSGHPLASLPAVLHSTAKLEPSRFGRS